MHRLALALALVTGCELDSELDAPLDGTTSDPALSVDAYVTYTSCDGAPCTTIAFDVRREEPEAPVPLLDAVTAVSADDGPAIAASVDPEAVHAYTTKVDHWIDRVRIDVTAGGETAALWADAVVSTPGEAAVELPEKFVAGSHPALRWHRQGPPVDVNVVFATLGPPLRLGFLEAFGPDDGTLELTDATFDQPGVYDVMLDRELVHELAGDAKLSLTWTSSWQQHVQVVAPPPL